MKFKKGLDSEYSEFKRSKPYLKHSSAKAEENNSLLICIKCIKCNLCTSRRRRTINFVKCMRYNLLRNMSMRQTGDIFRVDVYNSNNSQWLCDKNAPKVIIVIPLFGYRCSLTVSALWTWSWCLGGQCGP